jgi:hypothetical protein
LKTVKVPELPLEDLNYHAGHGLLLGAKFNVFCSNLKLELEESRSAGQRVMVN